MFSKEVVVAEHDSRNTSRLRNFSPYMSPQARGQAMDSSLDTQYAAVRRIYEPSLFPIVI